jgi:hypothetical protein
VDDLYTVHGVPDAFGKETGSQNSGNMGFWTSMHHFFLGDISEMSQSSETPENWEISLQIFFKRQIK